MIDFPTSSAVLNWKENVDVAEFLLPVSNHNFWILDLIKVSKLNCAGIKSSEKHENKAREFWTKISSKDHIWL